MSHIDLKPIARLGRLHFKEEELKVLRPQIDEILDFVERLKEVKVEGIEPTSHPLSLQNVFREDEASASIPMGEFLSRAPRVRGNFFEVPKIIEEKS